VYNGQPDPDDLSHFTVEVRIDGKIRVIDGWLRDDETLQLEERKSMDGAVAPADGS
jgi:hypothetical protein